MNSDLRKQENELNDESLAEELAEIEALYKEVSCELPPAHLDGQVLRHARAEIVQPRAKKPFKRSVWQRFELPAFAMSIFIATAWALQTFWPKTPPAGVYQETSAEEPGSATHHVEFEVQALPQPGQRVARDKRALPELELPEDALAPRRAAAPPKPEPQMALTDKMPQKSPTGTVNSATSAGTAIDKESLQTQGSNQMKNADVWAAEIIELVKQGHSEQARSELMAFKKAWPDYPIDEQLSAIRGLR